MSEDFQPKKVKRSVWLFHFRTSSGKETNYIYRCIVCQKEIPEEHQQEDFCPYCKTQGIAIPFLRCYYDVEAAIDFIRPMYAYEMQLLKLALLRSN